MKDLKFSGGVLTNSIVFRVDSISGSSNITVLESYGLNDRSKLPIDLEVEKNLVNSFKKLSYTMNDFKAFALAQGLDFVVSETNGTKEVQIGVSLIISTPVAGSSSNVTTPTFSGTGTPGGAVIVVVDSTTLNAVVGTNGTWSVVSTALSVGAKNAAATLSKGGVSLTKNVAFTITV